MNNYTLHLFLVGAVLIAVLSSFVVFGGSTQLRRMGHAFAGSIWEEREALLGSASIPFDSITTSKQELVRENRELYEEVSRLRRETFQTRILEADNRILKSLLGRNDDAQPLVAAVLRGPAASPYDSLIIDVGEKEGVQGNELVRAPGGIAIGFVAEAFSDTSSVVLFSSYGESMEVILGVATSTHVTALGEGGGMFSVSVPRSITIEIGDPIRIPSLGGDIAAVVEEVATDTSNAFTRAYFRTPVNFSSLRFIEVLPDTRWNAKSATPDIVTKEDETATDTGVGELEKTP